jgi:hypothetical protein
MNASQFELFDLAAARAEEKNVAAENPAVVARLRRDYDAWLDDMRARTKLPTG